MLLYSPELPLLLLLNAAPSAAAPDAPIQALSSAKVASVEFLRSPCARARAPSLPMGLWLSLSVCNARFWAKPAARCAAPCELSFTDDKSKNLRKPLNWFHRRQK